MIDVSNSKEERNGATGGLMLDVGFSMIMERLTHPGQLVCNPLMLDKCDSAIAASRTGRRFIGATDVAGNLARMKAKLTREGVPFEGD